MADGQSKDQVTNILLILIGCLGLLGLGAVVGSLAIIVGLTALGNSLNNTFDQVAEESAMSD